MFWKSCAEQAKCQREHLIRELTFPEAGSLEGALDRQETQQREKNPHLCARISPHRVLTPSPGVCQNTPEHRMAAGPTFRTNYQSRPPPAPRPQTLPLCVGPVIVKCQLSSSPCRARYTEEILLSVKLKSPSKINTRTTFF